MFVYHIPAIVRVHCFRLEDVSQAYLEVSIMGCDWQRDEKYEDIILNQENICGPRDRLSNQNLVWEDASAHTWRWLRLRYRRDAIW